MQVRGMTRPMGLLTLLARVAAIALLVLVPGVLLARAFERVPGAWRRLGPAMGVVAVPGLALAVSLVFRLPLRWPLFVASSVVLTLLGALLVRRR